MKSLHVPFLIFCFVCCINARSQITNPNLPLSIITSPSAVPVFIGYTEKTEWPSGKSLLYVPTKISSFLDFKIKFGGASKSEKFLLYPSLELYFLNGGTACYIVSIGSYVQLRKNDFIKGIQAVKKNTSISLMAFPDAVDLPGNDLYMVQRYALNQAANVGNRFCLFDIKEAANAVEHQAAITEFKKNIGTDYLSFGAAYAPFILNKKNKRIPPSAVMAGIYCKVDQTKGVWKAPANEKISGCTGLAITLSNTDIAAMTVDTKSGISINALRMLNKNAVVWGARTLDGNNNEWRYIPVRRFFMIVQQSIKNSLQQIVTLPNNNTTWQKIKTAIENYFFTYWQSGALKGSKPNEAYFVKIGLGETMTAVDVQQKRIIIEYGLSLLRLAAFTVGKITMKLK